MSDYFFGLRQLLIKTAVLGQWPHHASRRFYAIVHNLSNEENQ